MAWLKFFRKDKRQFSDIPNNRLSVEILPSISKSLENRYKYINPKFPFEWFSILEKAIIANPILSQMHQLIIDLANSGHTIEVVSNNSELIKSELDKLAQKLNIDNFINQLLSQLAIYGAISIEIIPNKDLEGIYKIIRVPVKTIRFKYNDTLDIYEPYQDTFSKKDFIKLNSKTYLYIPIFTLDDSPYGIPPFLSALSSVETSEELLSQIKSLSKKIGLIGFLDLQLPLPPKAPSETEFEYRNRLQNDIESISKTVYDNISKGIVIHYEGTELNFKELSNSLSGISELSNMIDKLIISGAKGQPSLLGRTEGSTETWATVSYEQFVKTLQNFQRTIKRALEYCYKLHISLLGYDFDDINIIFNPLPSLNPDKDAQNSKIKVDNTLNLLNSGLIDNQKAKTILDIKE
ncbi:MAG: DUF1073 domain-containing protein [Candidatus Dojkabacteria bacterium]|nr:DUF1073 domain-containing protein [Candidatus Dojkabacteria bacterium]